MTRPASYRDDRPERRCGTCRHSYRVDRYREYSRFRGYTTHMDMDFSNLLCLRGEEVVETPGVRGIVYIVLNGKAIGAMEPAEYVEVLRRCDVEDLDCAVCDEWEKRL